MGIESDQLVYDYLSRVGDLAQTTLPAARRRELVTGLRNDIERQRRDGDSPAAVRRILGRLGSPDEVVQAAAHRTRPPAGQPPTDQVPAAPPRPAAAAPDPPGGSPSAPAGPSVPMGRPAADPGAGPAHPADGEPEWWRVTGPLPPGGSAARTNGVLAGWTGGLEIPLYDGDGNAEQQAVPGGGGAGPQTAGGPVEAAAVEQSARPRRRWPRLGRRPAPPSPAAAPAAAAAAGRRRGLPVGPVELVAALALVAGVVLGLWLPLGIGWLFAYGSRRLSRTEAKWAALGMPGLVAAGGLVWLWGRMDGRWGQPLPSGQLGPVLSADFPVVVRVAALASAGFLLWRGARRSR